MAGSTLMSAPLEIRHQIFGYVSAPNGVPKKVLRRWFEKKEVKELIAQMQTKNPGGPTPVASYDTRDPYEEDTDVEEAEAEENQEQEDEDENSEAEEQEEDEENEADDQVMDEQDDNDDDNQGEDVEAEDDEMDEPPEVQDDGEAMDDAESPQDAAQTANITPPIQDQDDSSVHGQVANDTHGIQSQHSDSTNVQIANNTDGVQGQAGDLSGAQADESADENINSDNEDNEGAESDVADDGQSGGDNVVDTADGDDMAIDNGNTTPAVSAIPPPAVPPPPPRPAPVVRPHHKWRHIPKFLRISQCPPPPELFLTCKELNREAKDWFYDTAVIRIDATGSFQHFTMFEHSLDQIVDAVFSPFESVRKVQVKFVWDTEWIRAHSNGFDDLFESLLHMRTAHVIQVLRRAPELREVVMEWHDSINDGLSTALKHNIFEKFTELAEEKLMQDKYITVNLNEHYLEAGKKPHRKSILGRKRIEFQNFADSGFEFK